jgi:thiol:disulfide interchange protein DsbA
MNCETIDAILDEHRTARLNQPERQGVAAHLAGCARCSESWAANDALLGENMSEPPPELLARALGRVPERRAQARAGRRRSVALAAGAAIAAVMVIAATFSLHEPYMNTVTIAAVDAIASIFSPRAPEASRDAGTSEGALATIVATEPEFVAGRDYEVLSLPAATREPVERISVVEFFDYGCFHCYAFEPELVGWEAREQQHVALTRVPVVWNPEAELHARAFYAAEVLGKLDALHAAFYEEIHTRGERLASAAAFAELFQRLDVDAAAFDEVFNSREVDARVQRAAALGREYGIEATPSLVVGGRYSTSRLEVVDYLVAKAAAEGAAYCAANAPDGRAACPSRRPGTQTERGSRGPLR